MKTPTKKNKTTKKKSQRVWTIRDSYTPYKNEFKELALEEKLYMKCLKEVFWEISKDLIREVKSITLPYRLGQISIKKRKNVSEYERQKPDYGYYNKNGKLAYHSNTHTNKYYFFWDWNTSGAMFTNHKYYRFIPARGNDKIVGKRGLAAWIKHCATDPYIKDYDRLIKR